MVPTLYASDTWVAASGSPLVAVREDGLAWVAFPESHRRCMAQSEEWFAGRVYLDMHKLDAAGGDQAPHASEESGEVKSTAA